jgi:hypothetical protein
MALQVYVSFQVQSIAWLVLAAVGISLYTCELQIDPDLKNPAYYLYFIYFCKYMTESFSIRTHPAQAFHVFQMGATSDPV